MSMNSIVYAVRAGEKSGVYRTWNDCKEALDSYKISEYRVCFSIEEAEYFLENNTAKWYEEIRQKFEEQLSVSPKKVETPSRKEIMLEVHGRQSCNKICIGFQFNRGEVVTKTFDHYPVSLHLAQLF